MNKNKVTTEGLAAYFRAEGDITTKEKVNVDFFWLAQTRILTNDVNK